MTMYKIYNTKEEMRDICFADNEDGYINPMNVDRIFINTDGEVEDEHGNYIGLAFPDHVYMDSSSVAVRVAWTAFTLTEIYNDGEGYPLWKSVERALQENDKEKYVSPIKA